MWHNHCSPLTFLEIHKKKTAHKFLSSRWMASSINFIVCTFTYCATRQLIATNAKTFCPSAIHIYKSIWSLLIQAPLVLIINHIWNTDVGLFWSSGEIHRSISELVWTISIIMRFLVIADHNLYDEKCLKTKCILKKIK
jgi:hypothetical protein